MKILIPSIIFLLGVTFAAGKWVEKIQAQSKTSEDLEDDIADLQEEGSPVIIEKLNALERRVERVESLLMDYLPTIVEERLERGEALHFQRRRGKEDEHS